MLKKIVMMLMMMAVKLRRAGTLKDTGGKTVSERNVVDVKRERAENCNETESSVGGGCIGITLVEWRCRWQ